MGALVVLTLWCWQGAALTTAEIVARNEPACLVVYGVLMGQPTAQGSGVVVDPRGLILCSAHQVKSCEKALAITRDGTKFELTILETDPETDLAVLDAGKPLPAVTLGTGTVVNGAPLVAITAPEGLSFTTAEGIVSNAKRLRSGKPQIQTDLNLSPGSSGGPVFDADGNLLGIVSANLIQASGQTLVTPITNASALLERHDVSVPVANGKNDTANARRDSEEIPLEAVEPTASYKQRDDALAAFNAGLESDAVGVKIACYEKATQADPDFFEAWFNLGIARMSVRNVNGAIEAYENAKRLRPKRVEVFRNLGRAWIRQGKLEKALAAFVEARALDPDSAQSHNDLGETQRRLRMYDEAAASFDKALTMRPNYPEALYNAGLLAVETNRGDDAITRFSQYLEAAPNARDADSVRKVIEELKSKK